MEELIDGKIVLSMRAIYQSKVGLGLVGKGICQFVLTPIILYMDYLLHLSLYLSLPVLVL